MKALAGYLPVDGGGAIEYVMILNGPTISDQSEYRPIWDQLVRRAGHVPVGRGARPTRPTMRRRSAPGARVALLGAARRELSRPGARVGLVCGEWADVEAEPPPTTTTTLPEGYDDPAPELDTDLLSMRRGGAEELAARARDAAYRTLLQPVPRRRTGRLVRRDRHRR